MNVVQMVSQVYSCILEIRQDSLVRHELPFAVRADLNQVSDTDPRRTKKWIYSW